MGVKTTVAPQAGAMVKVETDGTLSTEVRAETAATAVAAAQEALVKARCAMARALPRDLNRARQRLLDDCRRPLFAEKAIFSKPVGSKKVNGKWEEQFVEGPSVRLAEAFHRQLGNIFVDAMVVVDDAEKRIIKVMAMDLETNATDAQDVTVRKTVERRDPKGRKVVSERRNSYGDMTYTVEATEDELLNLVNAAVAKMRRNKIIVLTPADLVEEAMRACQETMASADAKDPVGAKKKIVAAFAEHKVSEADLSAFIGHSLDNLTQDERVKLRKIYAALDAEETTWAAVVQGTGAANTPMAPQAPVAPPAPAAQPSATQPPAVDAAPKADAPPASPPAAVPPAPVTEAPPANTAQEPTPTEPPVEALSPEEQALADALAKATSKKDVTALIKRIKETPEAVQGKWRQRFNERMKELP